MERWQQPYSIQKRPTKHENRFMFYVKFQNTETGKYMNINRPGAPIETTRSGGQSESWRERHYSGFEAHPACRIYRAARPYHPAR